MENQLKKPPSHIAAILIFGFMGFMGLVQAYGSSAKFHTPIWISLIFPCIFIIGFFGVVKTQKWSRIYCSAVVGLFMLFILTMTIFLDKAVDQNLILAVCVDSLLGWWLYSFAFGKASKDYFKAKNT